MRLRDTARLAVNTYTRVLDWAAPPLICTCRQPIPRQGECERCHSPIITNGARR